MLFKKYEYIKLKIKIFNILSNGSKDIKYLEFLLLLLAAYINIYIV